MEIAALLMALASGAGGFVLRRRVSRRVSRVLLIVGASALVLALGTLAVVTAGRISIWTGSLALLSLSLVAIVVLPFGLVARYAGP